MGARQHVIGYEMVKDAAECVVEDPDLIRQVTKQLYPLVAMRYGTNWKNVERGIRYLIYKIWDQSDEVRLGRFGFVTWDRPCGTQFIAVVAEHARGRLGARTVDGETLSEL